MVIRKDVSARMSRVVEHNGTVYLAGIVSDDKTADIKVQAARVLEIAEKKLAMADVTKHDILRVEIFVKDIASDFTGFNEIWDEWVSKENPPARACIEGNMATATTLVEIIVTAAKS